jgi:hypothetical protein
MKTTKTPTFTTTPALPANSDLTTAILRHAESQFPKVSCDAALRMLLREDSGPAPATLPTGAFVKTPDGRVVIPLVVSYAGLELLSCAANKSGWNLTAFILDAAVCRAQDIRTECERRRIPFADFDGPANTSYDDTARDDTPQEPSPDLRCTHGKKGITPLPVVR